MPKNFRSALLRTSLAGAFFGLAAVSGDPAWATTDSAASDPVETRSIVTPKPVTALQMLLEDTASRGDPDADVSYLTQSTRKAVAGFYAARNFKPIWTETGAPTLTAYKLVARMERAEEDGLSASDYALPSDLLSQVGRLDVDDAARFERALSAALLTYAEHAQAGRVEPSSLSGYITASPERPDLSVVLDRLSSSADPVAVLDGFNPPHAGFQALRRKLAALRNASAEDAAPPVVPAGKVLKEGVRDPRVAILRERMGLAADERTETPVAEAVSDTPAQAPVVSQTTPVDGEADAPVEAAVDATLFDARLKDAVLAFQTENGLHADGIVGPRTLLALNATADDGMAISDIIANMERWRWLPRDLGAFHVFVNIPEFKARLVRDGREVYETRVVVGKPANQTPVFSDEMDHLIVNPYWNVPYSIASQELLPSIQANPTGYLARRNYEVVAGGRVVSPASIDWTGVNLRSVRIRQRPGSGNALGRIKFMFPNQHSVYLHDTPSKRLFNRSRRAFSHGCVRVEDPFAFADALLQLDPQWNAAALKKMIGGSEKRVDLKRHIPVHLTYFTAHVDEAGRLQRRPDIYGHNARLTKALEIEGWQEWQRFAVAAPVKRASAVRRSAAPKKTVETLSIREQRAKVFRLRQRGSNDLYR
ncbi:murein L,D-transpeptidase [Stappia sp. ES.058]|uniref:L,D-transpeptidase family protein n=1 Tax=Stappia sp. ES.058 TaxID=1881061 RepID=UPI00087A17E3|nr:L,D-transpeptidase family protein [Stappia sp. ES.058]SDU35611.1 Murein L,D-transpeptidase YcbB/YkuD [Stappia sp. ES.058]